MRNKELLRNIYRENKAINRNIQRLAHIGFIGLFGKAAKESSDKGDKKGKMLAKIGLILIALSEVLVMVSALLDYRKAKMEEELEELEG